MSSFCTMSSSLQLLRRSMCTSMTSEAWRCTASRYASHHRHTCYAPVAIVTKLGGMCHCCWCTCYWACVWVEALSQVCLASLLLSGVANEPLPGRCASHLKLVYAFATASSLQALAHIKRLCFTATSAVTPNPISVHAATHTCHWYSAHSTLDRFLFADCWQNF